MQEITLIVVKSAITRPCKSEIRLKRSYIPIREVRSFLNERMIDMNMRKQNLFNNLVSQIERVKKENVRQGSAGKNRYESSQRNFAKHLSVNYCSQNFRNVRDLHIKSF